jgi:hypothetical protein
VLRCGAADAAQCLQDHIRPRLRVATISSDGKSIRALAPCHPDRTPSLSVSLGDARPVIWNCFACKDSEKTRNALITSCQIDPRCLRRPVDDERRFEDDVLALFSAGVSHAEFKLRVRALSESYPPGELPTGGALADLASRSGVSLSQTYRRRVPSPRNPVQDTKITNLSNRAGQRHV